MEFLYEFETSLGEHFQEHDPDNTVIIRYKDSEGVTRHLVLEIQLHNKVEDCINKYADFKNIILDNRKDWNSIPRIICITDMKDRIELKGLKVLYDNTEMNNLDEVLRG